jgi:hypothetical protein
VTDAILRLHGFGALAIVFLIPALEDSAFVGLVFPGEIAVLLGGVLAFQGRVPLWAVTLRRLGWRRACTTRMSGGFTLPLSLPRHQNRAVEGGPS